MSMESRIQMLPPVSSLLRVKYPNASGILLTGRRYIRTGMVSGNFLHAHFRNSDTSGRRHDEVGCIFKPHDKQPVFVVPAMDHDRDV